MTRNMKLQKEEGQRAPPTAPAADGDYMVRVAGGRRIRRSKTGESCSDSRPRRRRSAGSSISSLWRGSASTAASWWSQLENGPSRTRGADPMEVTATLEATTMRRPPADETPAKAARGQTSHRPVGPMIQNDPWQRRPSQGEPTDVRLQHEALAHEKRQAERIFGRKASNQRRTNERWWEQRSSG